MHAPCLDGLARWHFISEIWHVLRLHFQDIANHQLQTLRPFLIRTSGQFELKTFRGRRGRCGAVEATKRWLQASYTEMLASKLAITLPSYQSPLLFHELPHNQQIYLATLKAMTDLIFFPSSSVPTSASCPHHGSSSVQPLPGYPETTYLDSALIASLSDRKSVV